MGQTSVLPHPRVVLDRVLPDHDVADMQLGIETAADSAEHVETWSKDVMK